MAMCMLIGLPGMLAERPQATTLILEVGSVDEQNNHPESQETTVERDELISELQALLGQLEERADRQQESTLVSLAERVPKQYWDAPEKRLHLAAKRVLAINDFEEAQGRRWIRKIIDAHRKLQQLQCEHWVAEPRSLRYGPGCRAACPIPQVV